MNPWVTRGLMSPLPPGRRSPRFDIWLVERYPLIRQDLTAANGAEGTDNLYINVTDIAVLVGGKSSNSPGHEDVVLAILAYVDFLMDLVKPRKKVFLALDGECAGLRPLGVTMRCDDPCHEGVKGPALFPHERPRFLFRTFRLLLGAFWFQHDYGDAAEINPGTHTLNGFPLEHYQNTCLRWRGWQPHVMAASFTFPETW